MLLPVCLSPSLHCDHPCQLHFHFFYHIAASWCHSPQTRSCRCQHPLVWMSRTLPLPTTGSTRWERDRTCGTFNPLSAMEGVLPRSSVHFNHTPTTAQHRRGSVSQFIAITEGATKFSPYTIFWRNVARRWGCFAVVLQHYWFSTDFANETRRPDNIFLLCGEVGNFWSFATRPLSQASQSRLVTPFNGRLGMEKETETHETIEAKHQYYCEATQCNNILVTRAL